MTDKATIIPAHLYGSGAKYAFRYAIFFCEFGSW